MLCCWQLSRTGSDVKQATDMLAESPPSQADVQWSEPGAVRDHGSHVLSASSYEVSFYVTPISDYIHE